MSCLDNFTLKICKLGTNIVGQPVCWFDIVFLFVCYSFRSASRQNYQYFTIGLAPLGRSICGTRLVPIAYSFHITRFFVGKHCLRITVKYNLFTVPDFSGIIVIASLSTARMHFGQKIVRIVKS